MAKENTTKAGTPGAGASGVRLNRRQTLGAFLGLGATATLMSGRAYGQRPEPPAIGDVLIDAQSREPLDPSAIVADASAPVLAFPTNPETGNIRGGARNKLLLIRQAEGENGEAPGPILAFSAVCTHQGCDVNVIDDDGMLLCPCHGSKFDPYDKGAVVAGPAELRLAGIAVVEQEGRLLVAGDFDGEIGAQQ